MYQITIDVPNEFLATLDEMVQMAGAPSREHFLRATIGNMLIQQQVNKEYMQKLQRRQMELSAFWQ